MSDITPMLATKWDPEKNNLEYPVALQPKIDGFRCLVKKVGSTFEYRSRKNRLFPHFPAQFDKEIGHLLKYMGNNVELDGEMYIPGIDFAELSSVIRNEKNHHRLLPYLTYCIFDFISTENLLYIERYSAINRAVDLCDIKPMRFIIVPIHFAHNKEEIINTHKHYVDASYEGTIIRKLDVGYRHGRSTNLLKFKNFIDEECVITGVEAAQGGEADAALLQVKDIRGNALTLRPSSCFEDRRAWLKDPTLIIGKKATIVYQELSADGIPRFPTVKMIRDCE